MNCCLHVKPVAGKSSALARNDIKQKEEDCHWIHHYHFIKKQFKQKVPTGYYVSWKLPDHKPIPLTYCLKLLWTTQIKIYVWHVSKTRLYMTCKIKKNPVDLSWGTGSTEKGTTLLEVF